MGKKVRNLHQKSILFCQKVRDRTGQDRTKIIVLRFIYVKWPYKMAIRYGKYGGEAQDKTLNFWYWLNHKTNYLSKGHAITNLFNSTLF